MIKINAPKHWAYRNSDGEYITDPEIRDGTEICEQVRFIRETDYRKLLKLARLGENFQELERCLGSSQSDAGVKS